MSKYEISSCINEWIFSFSGLVVEAENKKEAVMEYLQRLKEEIDMQDSSNIDWVLEKADDCIWELKDDEFIHHKDGNKLNNDLSNLELIYPEKHAKEHYISRNIDKKTGQFVCSEPKFNEIMFRLYDKDRNCTKEYTLSKLIYTKFKRNKFEYRGMSTGLKDKNGKLIYEGDILKCVHSDIMKYKIYWGRSCWRMKVYGTNNEIVDDAHLFLDTGILEVVGNIHENADLLGEE